VQDYIANVEPSWSKASHPNNDGKKFLLIKIGCFVTSHFETVQLLIKKGANHKDKIKDGSTLPNLGSFFS